MKNMKKMFAFGFLAVLAAAILISGCGGGSGGGGGWDDHHSYSMILSANTERTGDWGETSYFITAFGCSNSDMGSIGTKSLTVPNQGDFLMNRHMGYMRGTKYYVGSSSLNQGEVRDPFRESAQRQYSTGRLTTPSGYSLSGTYSGRIGEMRKEFQFSQENYLPELRESQLHTGSGGFNLNVSEGDTITLTGLYDNSIGYFCVIYNNTIDSSNVETIWASSDIRSMDWIDTERFMDFVNTKTESSAGGSVTFVIPAGVLNPQQDLTAYIYAIDRSTMESDSSGDFQTLVYGGSSLSISLQGR